jgi:DNA-binding CsgD family transcriptional regulator
MSKPEQSAFVEILVDRLIIESFPIEKSPYHREPNPEAEARIDRLRELVIWHINHSLSRRQKEVLKLYLYGKREAEIGRILGIKQQVVNIYKHRAINRLKLLVKA